MTRKAARIISILAFVALLRPCGHLLQFLELLVVQLLGFGFKAMPTTLLLTAIYDAYGIVAVNLASWAIGVTIAAIPAILLYRFLVRRDFKGVCKDCASHRGLSWLVFSLFVFFSVVQPQWILRPLAIDSEPLPLDDAMAQNPTTSLELCLCHPDSDKLVGELCRDGELSFEALASADRIDGYRLMPMTRDGSISDACYVSETVELSNGDVQSATARQDFMHQGKFSVDVKLNAEGKRKFRELTRAYAMGGTKNLEGNLRRLAVVVNGQLVVAPIIYEEIKTGECVISSISSQEEAIALAAALNAHGKEED